MRIINKTSGLSLSSTLLCWLLLALASPALAMNLQQAMDALPEAKAQGLVGEQSDGYLGVVRSSGRADTVARLINEARRAEYQRLARDNQIAIGDVEALAGRKAIDRTPAGQYIRLPSGEWRRK